MHANRVILLTGETGSGKTLALQQTLPELEKSGVLIGGLLAPGRFPDSGGKEYDLELYPGGKKYFLSTRITQKDWQIIGDFHFNPVAVEAGLKHLRCLPLKTLHLYLLDEIGPFELNGLLWSPAIPDLLDKGIPMIWTVRYDIIQQVCSKWELKNPEIIIQEKGQIRKTIASIKKCLKKNIQELS